MLDLLILIFLVLPLIFQLVFGYKAIIKSTRLNLWEVCLCSFSGQIVSIFINYYLMIESIRESQIKCGLPIFGMVIIGIFFGLLTCIVMIIQAFINYDYNKKDKNKSESSQT